VILLSFWHTRSGLSESEIRSCLAKGHMACFTDAKQARQDSRLVMASCAGMCAQVEQLQAQVRVLQAVGYGAVEADESGDGPSVGSPGAADSLEAALLGKARRLEHELTMARLRIAELAGTTQEICTIEIPCSLVCLHFTDPK
jgi:hypothetical protein